MTRQRYDEVAQCDPEQGQQIHIVHECSQREQILAIYFDVGGAEDPETEDVFSVHFYDRLTGKKHVLAIFNPIEEEGKTYSNTDRWELEKGDTVVANYDNQDDLLVFVKLIFGQV